jgi:hypothetical protein
MDRPQALAVISEAVWWAAIMIRPRSLRPCR